MTSSGTTIVYQITNLVNGKFYIGVTSGGLDKRKWHHLHCARYAKDQRYLYCAMRKSGVENFTFSILAECENFADGLAKEIELIAVLKPHYNLTAGGEGVTGHRHTKESKEKMRLAKVGKPSVWTTTKMPQAVRERLAACRRAERGQMRNERQQAATLRNSKKGNESRRRKVENRITGDIYESARAAAKALGLSLTTVVCVCNGGRKNCSGIDFGYIEARS